MGKKPILEWLDDNKWTTHFPNWDTYSFFQQQEIKTALHQYALGLFLRVWEEVSTIFIGDISNIPASPFMKMLAVFARKEYQAEVGNILHIIYLETSSNL